MSREQERVTIIKSSYVLITNNFKIIITGKRNDDKNMMNNANSEGQTHYEGNTEVGNEGKVGVKLENTTAEEAKDDTEKERRKRRKHNRRLGRKHLRRNEEEKLVELKEKLEEIAESLQENENIAEKSFEKRKHSRRSVKKYLRRDGEENLEGTDGKPEAKEGTPQEDFVVINIPNVQKRVLNKRQDITASNATEVVENTTPAVVENKEEGVQENGDKRRKKRRHNRRFAKKYARRDGEDKPEIDSKPEAAEENPDGKPQEPIIIHIPNIQKKTISTRQDDWAEYVPEETENSIPIVIEETGEDVDETDDKKRKRRKHRGQQDRKLLRRDGYENNEEKISADIPQVEAEGYVRRNKLNNAKNRKNLNPKFARNFTKRDYGKTEEIVESKETQDGESVEAEAFRKNNRNFRNNLKNI